VLPAMGNRRNSVMGARDPTVASLMSATSGLGTAGLGNASLFAYGTLDSMTTAGGNVSATSFGTLQRSHTFTDVSVYAESEDRRFI
jgi:hypothetical protein